MAWAGMGGGGFRVRWLMWSMSERVRSAGEVVHGLGPVLSRVTGGTLGLE